MYNERWTKTSSSYKQTAMHQQEQNYSFLVESLYCEEEEERWEEEEEEVSQESTVMHNSLSNTFNGTRQNPLSCFPLLLVEQDLLWEDEELFSLFSKEQEQAQVVSVENEKKEPFVSVARQEGVEWMLKVNAHYGFSALTAILAVNYLDRFVSTTYYQKDNPWMIQLVAVACLSVAAKVEETQVPLLLDLQVEGTKYVFEAKTIQRMELLVLSALKWKMQPVTPLSFLDHIIRRLGLKTHLLWEFLRRCDGLLLSVITDSRSVSYLPSVLATAAAMHVIDQVEPFNFIDYKKRLLGVLKICEEKVKDCYEFILEASKTKTSGDSNKRKKRKHEPIPNSPSGVIEADLSCDSSNDSGALGSSLSVSSSPEPLFKKSRTQDQWVFVDIAGSPH